MIFINQIKLISDSAGYINKETLSLINVEEEKIKTVKDVKEKLSYYGIIFGLILNDLFSRKARIGSLVLNVKNREVNNDYEKGLKIEE